MHLQFLLLLDYFILVMASNSSLDIIEIDFLASF